MREWNPLGWQHCAAEHSPHACQPKHIYSIDSTSEPIRGDQNPIYIDRTSYEKTEAAIAPAGIDPLSGLSVRYDRRDSEGEKRKKAKKQIVADNNGRELSYQNDLISILMKNKMQFSMVRSIGALPLLRRRHLQATKFIAPCTCLKKTSPRRWE